MSQADPKGCAADDNHKDLSTNEIYAMLIAGKKTSEDWHELRCRLASDTSIQLWQEAVSEFFHARLFDRYMTPIRHLQKGGADQGEGFAIVAIQCTMIEFLESIVQGRNYRHSGNGEVAGEYEYSRSRELFVKFLLTREPFKHCFQSASLAESFYVGVRCGLLHEARTKNGWRIRAKSTKGKIIDPAAKIIYRNDFQAALLKFVDWYESQVPVSSDLQAAFVRKFESLCRDE